MIARERDEVDRHALQHHLGAEEHRDQVAAGEKPDQPDAEQRRGDREVVPERRSCRHHLPPGDGHRADGRDQEQRAGQFDRQQVIGVKQVADVRDVPGRRRRIRPEAVVFIAQLASVSSQSSGVILAINKVVSASV